ncbi:hypothetical protein BDY21DRAFT_95708 [Lineolata rhizophorae]|uniref:Uncharacterized protein n=1 Tax=Lineolata rhizophorae TaxID=578093 RepID=A0A6A6NTL2_9PEZI|nr:hypothetical protein BDY21DRAFT_95708 [Lineolata rhizophorae]
MLKKLPGISGRRKSAGTNALDEFDQPSGESSSSFRVMTRDEVLHTAAQEAENKKVHRKSLVSGRPFSTPLQQQQQRNSRHAQHSFDEEFGSSNRGSDGSSASRSTGSKGYDTASSMRFSSSSTLPSSADVEAEDNIFKKSHAGHKQSSDHTFSLRGAAKSIGIGRGHWQTGSGASRQELGGSPYDTSNEYSKGGRDRSQTTSSYASTATPPKLGGDIGLGFSDFGNDFGSYFSGMDKRRSAIMEESQTGGPRRSDTEPVRSYQPKPELPQSRSFNTPQPIRIDKSKEIDQSPYSWDSRDSGDGLMSSPRTDSPSLQDKPPPPPPHAALRANSYPTNIPEPPVPAHTERRSGRFGTPKVVGGLQRRSNTSSGEIQDADAELVRRSVNASRAARRSNSPPKEGRPPARPQQSNPVGYSPSDASLTIPSLSSASSSLEVKDKNPYQVRNLTPETPMESRSAVSNNTTPRAAPAQKPMPPLPKSPDAEPVQLFEDSDAALASVAAKYTSSNQNDVTEQPKVMNAAQFERYKKQKEMSGGDSDSENSSEAGSDYDDDDTERDRKQQEARRKQAAHLAVHRQQMRKVVGGSSEEPGPLPDRPGLGSTLSLPAGLSSMGLNDGTGGGKSSDEEDEDIPLGVLQAHGFPGKNRPPSRLPNAPVSWELPGPNGVPPRPATATGGPRSVSGMSVAGGPDRAGGPLPAFARNLPKDVPPFFGAGLVQAPNRESLMYGRNPTGPPPGAMGNDGGLVGVIAQEERARAARRGSPNMQTGQFSMPQQQQQQMPQQQVGGGMGMNGMGMNGMGMIGGGMGMGMGQMGMMGPQMMGQQGMPNFDQQMLFQQQMAQQQQMQQMLQAMAMMTGQQLNPMGMGMGINPQQQNFQGNQSLRPPSMASVATQQRPPRAMSMTSQTPFPMGMGQQQQPMQQPWLTPAAANRSTYAPSVMNLAPPPPPLHGGGYAPSLAPSERSNIGMASRYRPVAQHQPNADTMSTVTSGTAMPGRGSLAAAEEAERPRSGAGGVGGKLRVGIRAKSKSRERKPLQRQSSTEDDDDEGWESMKKKRNATKGKWGSGGAAAASSAEARSASEPSLAALYYDVV